MMIAYPPADICRKLREDKVLTIVVENQHIFYSLISDIQKQLEGMSGEFVISEDYQPLDMRKYTELIAQFVPFSVNQKELISKLHSGLKKQAVDAEMFQSTHELLSKISQYLYMLTEDQEI